LAASRRLPLLTRDVDFIDLSHSLKRHYGIIYLRITPRTMPDVHRMLITALRQLPATRLREALLLVDATTYRLHHRPAESPKT
jgi:predicted nuclease of predicted toxin-antitoxin system